MTKDPWKCEHELFDPRQVHYCRYINLEILLGLVKPNVGTEDARDFLHPDENQFIVVHQMVELGFALHIQTLWQLIQKIEEEDYSSAVKLVRRLISWTEIHGTLITVLKNNMDPKKFAEFRELLAPASGLESEQYRIIEVLSGVQQSDPYGAVRGVEYAFQEFLDRVPENGEGKPKVRLWTQRLEDLSKGKTVRRVFNAKFASHGNGSELDKKTPIDLLLVALVDYDKAFRKLRTEHMHTATRQIGSKPGTGHTDGVPYLKSVTEGVRFFPELWGDE